MHLNLLLLLLLLMTIQIVLQSQLIDSDRFCVNNFFFSGQYTTCVQSLLQLSISEETQQRIIHNIAVADLYNTGFKNHALFLSHLKALMGEAQPEQFNEILGQSFATLLFNKAIVHYHTRHTIGAWKILSVLLRFLNIFDAPFVQRIGLLSIEILLNSNQPHKVEEIIDLINKRLNLRTDSRSGSDTDDSQKGENQIKCTVIRNLDYFQWMYRLYKVRAKVMVGTVVNVPLEEVSLEFCTNFRSCSIWY